MHQGFRSLFAILALTCATSSILSAQSAVATTAINGTVTDPSSASVAGAKVTARNTETGLTRQTQTTNAGLYVITELPVGVYDLDVEQAGFSKAVRNGIHLTVGSPYTVNVQLEVGTTTQTVDVTSDAPVVQTSRTTVSSTVSERQVQDLPVNGRNFLDFTTLSPGVVRDPSRGGDLSFGGQRGTSNSLLVDGSDANNTFYGQSVGRAGTGRNPYSFSEDAVQEFQVNVNGYNAEIGRAGGGVINVITKSGTNSFHGDAFEFYRDKSLNANSWDNNARGLPRRAYHYNQFGGNVGGPIVRDKAFFFFDYDGQRNTTPNTVIPGAFPPAGDALAATAFASLQQYFGAYANSLNNDVYLTKIDWNITDRQRVTFRYDANRFTGQNYENSGATSALGHTGNSNVSTDNAGAIYTAVLGATKVFEGRFFYTRDYEPGFANSAAPETIVSQSGSTVISFGRNSFSPRSANIDTLQPTANLSWVAGAHSLKFGIDTIFQQIANYFPGNFSGSYVFSSLDNFANKIPSTFTQAFAGPGTTGPTVYPNVNEYAAYVEDSWRINRKLTLNYGLRYDYFNYAQPRVLNSDPSLAAMNVRTNRIHRDPTDIGPRIALAYAPTDDGKTVFRLGYGVFYAVTPSIFTGTAFTQNGIQVQSFVYSGAAAVAAAGLTYPNVLPSIPTGARTPSLFVFANDFKNPQVQQWNGQIEHSFGNNFSVTLGYLGNKGSHLPRTRDINLNPAVPRTVGSFTFMRFPGAQSAPIRPNPNYARIWLAESGADSNYNAAFVQISKRFASHFLLQSSYTWAHAIDDAPDATAVVFGADDAKLVQNQLMPNLDRGNANADIRQRFVFSGVWDINYVPASANPVLRAIANGWQLATLANVQTGRPYSATIGGSTPDLNNDGNTRNDRAPFTGRNAFRGPNFMTDDVRVSRFIPLGTERVRLQLIGEAFNVTNRVNFVSVRTAEYSYNGTAFTRLPTFLTPAPGNAAGDPRILQLAAKLFF